MGEGVIARASGILISEGIGSCVVVTLYDPRQKIGGMAHIMLPTDRRRKAEDRWMQAEVRETTTWGRRALAEDRRKMAVAPPALARDAVYRFADTAVANLLKEMLKEGARIQDISAKMIGGASMFEFDGDNQPGIGELNISGIQNILKKEGIPAAGKEIGGRHGRSVEFWLNSGRVVVRTIGMGHKEI
jgi:chemotaxis protein CheD